jgi:hypothetical protein
VEGSIVASGGVEGDAKKLLRVLAGKDGAREGRPVSAGPEDAAAAGFEAGPYGERLHRALWRLIASGELEGVVDPGPTADDGPGPGAVYRITRSGLEKVRGG